MQLNTIQPVHFLGLISTSDNTVGMFLFYTVLSVPKCGTFAARCSDFVIFCRTRHVAAAI